MAIQAQLPDGTTLEFPDGTPPAVVDGAVKQHVGGLPGGVVETRESKLGFSPAPPEPTKPAPEPTPILDDFGRQVLTPAETPGVPVVGGNTPGYRQSDILPIARREDVIKDPNSRWYEGWALAPGPLRALGQTPAENTTIDPNTGTMNVAPEALTAAMALGGVRSPLRFSEPVPPMPPPNQLLLPAPPPRAPPQPGPPEAIPMPAPQSYWERLYAEGRAPAPGFEAQVTMRDPGAAPPAPEPPGAAKEPQPAPSPPPEPPAVAAGAQVTPATQAGLTPAQAAAAGSTADKQWFYKTVTPGEANDIQYLDGITPTMAQREQTVNAARDSKVLRRLSPEAEQNERALLSEHSDIRKDEFQNIAGSDTTQQADLKAANDQIETALQAAYAHSGTVDLQPVINAANAELTGSAGKLPPLRAAMQEIVAAAQKSDGSGLETSPLQANAVRRAIIYMQSKQGRLANPGYGAPDVMAALTRVKDELTKQIEPAAPGFTEANANYAKARQAIDAREALQAYEPKLYDGFGHMKYMPFRRLMGDVVAGRDPAAPLNPYKALTDEQMARLKSIHDDLQRAASAEELARANGSDTTQTLFDMARRAAAHSVGTLAGMGTGIVVGHFLGPGAASAAGMTVRSAVDHYFGQRAINQATAEHNRLLRPDVTQYPVRPNPLMQPPP
jgi:hypothetical protein